MSLYNEHILPHLIDCVCTTSDVMALRQDIVPRCRGDVLEVGMGSGANLRFYKSDQVTRLYGLEPSDGMRRKAARNLANSPVAVEWLDLPGEAIPLEDNSVDTVLLTFTLCTIPDWFQALKQMKRVLRADGQLLFCEHGQSPDPGVRRWQNRLTPGWKRIAGGCHLNRPIHRLIAETGFNIDVMETRYLPRTPRFAGYVYSGTARPAD